MFKDIDSSLPDVKDVFSKEHMLTTLLSKSHDTVENLAMEEALLHSITPKNQILLLYENNPAVVIGRFQNPWQECRTGLARKLAIPVLRRMSGGGTVVHGRGNLNWSVISASCIPDKRGNIQRMVRALSVICPGLCSNDRHDVLFTPPGTKKQYKISGSAFRQTASGSIHHATLLVNADLSTLRSLLTMPQRDIHSKSTPSHSCSVANLAYTYPALTMQTVIDLIVEEWSGTDAIQSIHPKIFHSHAHYRNAIERMRSDDWNWGKTPDFTEYFRQLPGRENAVLECQIQDGRIQQAQFSSETDRRILNALIGSNYNGRALMKSQFTEYLPEWLQTFAKRVDSN